tara:strand:- start:629 stop:1069 length:441 start_codon:yes stop_codon:yes gene_type:complete
MSLKELLSFLNEKYEMNILNTKTRKRKVVYARKIAVNIALSYGYQIVDITNEWGVSHCKQIYYRNTFSEINPIDLHHYNLAIDEFKLPMKKIPNLRAIDGNPMLDEMIDEISKLGFKDLKFFKNKVFDKFKKNLAYEKEVTDLGFK